MTDSLSLEKNKLVRLPQKVTSCHAILFQVNTLADSSELKVMSQPSVRRKECTIHK